MFISQFGQDPKKSLPIWSDQLLWFCREAGQGNPEMSNICEIKALDAYRVRGIIPK